MIDVSAVPATDLVWRGAVRIIRSLFPPIDLFEDIADPADWPLILAAEQKTNPRLMESVGNLALVPPERRVSGPGASWLMAPFTHVSPDRPSRFSAGGFGVLYAGDSFEVALFETVHHHGRFMAATKQPPGWTSQFREILLDVEARLHDLREPGPGVSAVLDPGDYAQSQALGSALHAAGSEGVVYPSVRRGGGACVGLFYPDGASNPVQGRHLDYHWNGERVDLYRDLSRSEVYRIVQGSG
ncbi:RES family NAD+ phosphorylase [Bosea sp. 685]|nr:RES family NAD+ phosphorylase [Bosea sp. 685]WNJ90740.1 RES family NAD+ phosphorylase [Bosea sp. 685]